MKSVDHKKMHEEVCRQDVRWMRRPGRRGDGQEGLQQSELGCLVVEGVGKRIGIFGN